MSAPATVEQPLWRGVDVFRTLTLLYTIGTCLEGMDQYARPVLVWVAMTIMVAWTLVFWIQPHARGATIMVADLLLACGLAAATLLVQTPLQIASGTPTLPSIWGAAAVLGWGVWRGAGPGMCAALLLAVVDVLVAGRWDGQTLHNNFLLLLLGGIVGYCADLFRSGQRALRRALVIEAATAERERLARDIHDSVLQVLAFVQRRAREIGGETRELGRLAGAQELRLRSLVSAPSTGAHTLPTQDWEYSKNRTSLRLHHGEHAPVDLRSLLLPLQDEQITVVTPAGAVHLPGACARELRAVVRAALDNVSQHAGAAAQAWVLVDDEGEHVSVTIRDDGVGFAPGRLAQAARDGRLGVALSVRGRVVDLGGTISIHSEPGAGTEVCLRVPRRQAS